MFPTVVSSEIQRALLDYLRTTFRLRDKKLEEALFRFLQDHASSMFQGPYLDVRLPFRKAEEDWESNSPLDFGPPFTPYAHQLRSFERLSSRSGAPVNTLVTTGTGSGKTECFLFPLLDHCRRARQRGEKGIKAIILYPMNALASDQAERLAKLLQTSELNGVSAGLYVGGKGTHGSPGPVHLVDDRDVLRKSPPDILLTNYRMLDFLLMRPEDSELWGQNHETTLQYLVLDELHTYDGAQGSDVACLIRRLKTRLGMPEGHLCCVGTSATIGSGGAQDPRQLLAEFATKIFAESFSTDCLIEEDRLRADETFLHNHDNSLEPYSEENFDFAKLDAASYERDDFFIEAQQRLWFKTKPYGRSMLCEEIGGHSFLHKLLRGLAGQERRSGPRHALEVLRHIAREDAFFAELTEQQQWLLVSSFVSMIAHARIGVEQAPFLQIQVQLWVRELHGLLRLVTDDGYRFAWQDDLKAAEDESWLPMVYCRECGFDGLATLKKEGEDFLSSAVRDIGEAFLQRSNRARVIERRHGAAVEAESGQLELVKQYLCPHCLSHSENVSCERCKVPTDSLHIKLHPTLSDMGKPLPLDRCPACQADEAIGFLASRSATLSSVAVSEIFASRFNDDRKLLAFTDSVQDASHRAGFFAARTFRFTMRTAIQSALKATLGDLRLNDAALKVYEKFSGDRTEMRAAAMLTPPDLNEDQVYLDYFGLEKAEAQRKQHKPVKKQREAMERLMEQRLSWEITREYGLAVPFGRSLDGTACSTLTWDAAPLQRASEELAALYIEHHRSSFRAPPSAGQVVHFLEGLLHRLRLYGGIMHPLLETYARLDDRYFLYKRKNPRLSRFGPRSTIPRFFYQGEARPKSTYQALYSSTKNRNWFRVWTARSLGLVQENDQAVNQMLDRAMRVLHEEELLVSLKGPLDKAVFGLNPTAASLTADVQRVRCSSCGHKLTLAIDASSRFAGQNCLRFSCHGGRYEIDSSTNEAESYYQRLFTSGRVERIYTGEHTGLLERTVREALERSFKQGHLPDSPNLLTCTPTLEMGIDIGDLSNVMLCSVPPLPSNYVQRVGRAGRSTGNASVVTMTSRRAHDRYFFEEPYEMLRGEISPPGCFLDAPEMLARQMLAHALDCWAREREKTRGAVIPGRMNLLRVNEEDAFPGQFWSYYHTEKERVTGEFLALFADHISEASTERLRALCTTGALVSQMRDAFVAVKEQVQGYSEQLKKIRARISELEEEPSKASAQVDEVTGEKRYDAEAEIKELQDAENAYSRLRAGLNGKYPLNVLADAGVIPNYAFPEPGVTLNALLRAPFDEKEPKAKGQRVEYQRAASQAIREFAPFNTFYAEGHKIKVSQVDLGNKGNALEQWRICAHCHYMQEVEMGEQPTATCPRCAHPRWSDVGQKRTMVLFRRAISVMNRIEASTAEDADEREQQSYRLAELIDVSPENYCGAKLLQQSDMIFGFELLQNQLLREVNFGRREDVAKPNDFAGVSIAQRGFLVCKLCGRVSESEERAQHAPTCLVRRRNQKPEFERIFLYRQFRSEALRLLLPLSQLEDARLLHSLKAALYLGFRKKFLGHPDHLNITLADEPRGGELRRFLVVYDSVPGGTGYLSELWRTDGILEVLDLALQALQSCRCVQDENKDGCYRCVYAYQQSHEIPHISRSRAVELLEEILSKRQHLVDVPTLSGVDMGDLTESELERKFLSKLQEKASKNIGFAWAPLQHGGKPCHLLTTHNSEWRIEPQVDIGPEHGVQRASRPDFVLYCLSNAKERPIAVFCDGLKYHVCPEKETSRLGDDIVKRNALLASQSFRVWSVTWKDLEESESVTSLLTRPQRVLYEQLEKKWGDSLYRRHQSRSSESSFDLLWDYLADPNEQVWQRDAEGFAWGMLSNNPLWSTDSIKQQQTALRESPLEVRDVLQAADLKAGAPKRFAGMDARPFSFLLSQIPALALQAVKPEETELTLRLCDDPESRKADGFSESWRAFLHAWNILQFHPRGVFVVSGESLVESGADLEEAPVSVAPVSVRGRAVVGSDIYERFAAEFSDGAHIPELAGLLKEHALPVPVEPTDLESPIELESILAWPDQKVVLVQEATDKNIRDWRELGWTAVDYDAPAETILESLKKALPKEPRSQRNSRNEP